MANPAELLLQTFRDWDLAGNNNRITVSGHRGIDANRTEALHRHEIALGHITAIRELLDILAATDGISVDVWRRYLPTWTAMILNHPGDWKKPVTPFDRNSLDHLETLAGQLKRIIKPVPDDLRQQLATAVTDLRALLVDDQSIPADMRSYLALLINHMQQALDEYHIRGDFDLRIAADLLVATLHHAAHASTDPDKRSAWGRLRDRFLLPVVVPAAIQAGGVWAQLALVPPSHGG